MEDVLKWEILEHLDQLGDEELVILKLSLPTQVNLYKELADHPNVIRVVALSGGYSREDANAKLKQNEAIIASFSRALSQDLRAEQSDEEFNQALADAVNSIYEASI